MLCYVMLYINTLTFFFTQIFKKSKDIRVISLANEGGIPIKLLISQWPKALES